MDVQEQQTVRINFELGPKDIEYFKSRLSKARKNRALRDDDRVILAAEALARQSLGERPTDLCRLAHADPAKHGRDAEGPRLEPRK